MRRLGSICAIPAHAFAYYVRQPGILYVCERNGQDWRGMLDVQGVFSPMPFKARAAVAGPTVTVPLVLLLVAWAEPTGPRARHVGVGRKAKNQRLCPPSRRL